MVPSWNLGGCTLCINWELKEFNTVLLPVCLFVYFHERQIYSIWNTEGKTQQKTNCNVCSIDKNAFDLVFFWFNQQGSKGWNTKTPPSLLANEIYAKEISQSRWEKSQEQCFFSKQEAFHFFKSHYSVVAFCFHRENILSLCVLSCLHFYLLNNL